MGETFRAAAIVSQYLIRLLAAGPFRGDLLQLVFEFFLGELSALETTARLDDFFDVELENIPPAKLTFGALTPSSETLQAGVRTLGRRA